MKQNYNIKKKDEKQKKELEGMSFADESTSKTIDLIDNTVSEGNGKPRPDPPTKNSQDQPKKVDVDED